MSKISRIETKDAPAAIGPYSQAVRAGDVLYVSGQIPLDPVSGQIHGKTAAEQSERVFQNIAAILRASDLSFEDVVRCDVFLASMNDFAAVNEVYANYFTQSVKPARQAVEVSCLPRNALVEISCIAYCPAR